MRKLTRTFTALSTIAITLIAAACSDGPTAASSSLRPGQLLRTTGVSVTSGDTTITTFTVDPTSSDMLVEAGIFKLKLAANSICDPAVSTYGASEWDKPCVALTTPIVITSRAWTTPSGNSIVMFSPDLRFVPGKVNTLYLWAKGATSSAVPQMAWCATGSPKCYNEAAADPSVAVTLGSNGFLTRRVKHFSGYTSTWGFSDDSTTTYGY